MRVGDIPHSSKKVSFNAHDPIREQLESLTSMVYNMSIQKDKNSRPLRPKSIKKEEEDKTDRILEIEIGHSVETDKDKILDLTIGDNNKTDACNVNMTIGEKVIDIKIIIIEMTVEVEGDKTLGEASVTTIVIEAEQEKDI